MNLSKFVVHPFTKNAYFDFNKFIEAVKIAVVGLNEVLDEGLNLHPLEKQREMAKNYRQIGLGVMGIADMLIKLNIRYGSNDSFKLSHKISKTMLNSALQQSAFLAKEHGFYPKYKKEAVGKSPFYINNTTKETKELVEKYGLRNSQVLTIAPTGSTSTMLGVSGGIEPIYMISYTRKTETLNDGEETFYKVFTPIAKEYMNYHGLTDENQLPKDLFITAMDLNYKDRIQMQSAWQRNIDASISSTVNVPENFTIEETRDLYTEAWRHNLKGITIFRDGCKRAGILGNHKMEKDIKNYSAEELKELLDKRALEELQQNPLTCPMCHGKIIKTGGCSECLDCGYSPCSI